MPTAAGRILAPGERSRDDRKYKGSQETALVALGLWAAGKTQTSVQGPLLPFQPDQPRAGEHRAASFLGDSPGRLESSQVLKQALGPWGSPAWLIRTQPCSAEPQVDLDLGTEREPTCPPLTHTHALYTFSLSTHWIVSTLQILGLAQPTGPVVLPSECGRESPLLAIPVLGLMLGLGMALGLRLELGLRIGLGLGIGLGLRTRARVKVRVKV